MGEADNVVIALQYQLFPWLTEMINKTCNQSLSSFYIHTHENFQNACVCQGTNACIFNNSIPERYMYRGVSVNVGLMAAMKSNHQILVKFWANYISATVECTHTNTNKNTHTHTHTHLHTTSIIHHSDYRCILSIAYNTWVAQWGSSSNSPWLLQNILMISTHHFCHSRSKLLCLNNAIMW